MLSTSGGSLIDLFFFDIFFLHSLHLHKGGRRCGWQASIFLTLVQYLLTTIGYIPREQGKQDIDVLRYQTKTEKNFFF